jgi:hypothetical protein
MADLVNTPSVIQEPNLKAFFHHSLTQTARSRRLEAADATLHYLTHLLTDYARTDRLFDHTEEGVQIRPLALLYRDALAAGSLAERRLWLRRLGDLALFVAGWFSGRLSRRLTDLDYCIAMGGNAYGYLHETADGNARDRALGEIFGELAGRFEHFVELVAAITDRGSERDLLQTYRQWQTSRNPALARRLRALGFDVDATGLH